MSDKQNIKDSILIALKDIFGKGEVEKAEIQMGQLKLSDGKSVIEFEGETPEIGKPVFGLSEDKSEKFPLPEGEHELENGEKLHVDKNGLVAETPAEEPSANKEVEALMEKHTKIKNAHAELSQLLELDKGVSAYLELPVGVHEIGGKTYTVEEVVDREGTDNEWKHNVIVSIVPKSKEKTEEPESEEEAEEATELSAIRSELKEIKESFNTQLQAEKKKNEELEAKLEQQPAEEKIVKTELKIAEPVSAKQRLFNVAQEAFNKN